MDMVITALQEALKKQALSKEALAASREFRDLVVGFDEFPGLVPMVRQVVEEMDKAKLTHFKVPREPGWPQFSFTLHGYAEHMLAVVKVEALPVMRVAFDRPLEVPLQVETYAGTVWWMEQYIRLEAALCKLLGIQVKRAEALDVWAERLSLKEPVG